MAITLNKKTTNNSSNNYGISTPSVKKANSTGFYIVSKNGVDYKYNYVLDAGTKNAFGDKALKSTVKKGNNIYSTFKGTDTNGKTYYYYINDKGVRVKLDTTTSQYDVVVGNKAATLDLDSTSSKDSSSNSSSSSSKTKSSTTNTSSGSGSSYSGSALSSYYTDKIADLEAQIEELTKPKVYSAQELADMFDIDYNEQNILNDYNEATNEYYDAMVADQDQTRGQYDRDATRYANQLVDNYLNSYKNAAPTATGKAAQAANALSTSLATNYTNSGNDYGMLQSMNTLEQQREAELANNEYSAKSYYTDLGKYFSQLATNYYDSDVANYKSDLETLASKYAADRSYQSYLAQSAAAKYAGLASAAGTTASSTTYDKYQALYNTYYSAAKNSGQSNSQASTYAARYVNNLLKTSTGNTVTSSSS